MSVVFRYALVIALLLLGGSPALAGPGDPASRIAARFAICGPPADNLGNTAWAACAAAVDDMYGKDQPAAAPPAPAAAATRAERVWVSGARGAAVYRALMPLP